jgi:glycosyltransferase involved in cell wall biosynthesis
MPWFFHPDVVSEFKDYMAVVHEVSTAQIFSTRTVQKDYNSIFDSDTHSTPSNQVVVSLGHDFQNAVASIETSLMPEVDFGVDTHYVNFLMVGTIEPRKGHGQILDAFEIAWSRGLPWRLLIVGREGWLSSSLMERILHHEELGKSIIFLGQLADSQLAQMYKLSDCLIGASYNEGFGLPLIEAQMAGLPLFLRDIDVFREIIGAKGFYSKMESAADIVSDLECFLERDRNLDRSIPSDDRPSWNKLSATLVSFLTRRRVS